MNKEHGTPPTGNIENESTSERDREALTESALQSEQVTPALVEQTSPQNSKVENKSTSESGTETHSDVALQIDLGVTATPHQEASQTGNVEDKATSKNGPEGRSDSALQTVQANIGPPHEKPPQPANVEDSSENGPEARTDSPLIIEQAIPALLNQEASQTGKVEDNAVPENITETRADSMRQIEQATTVPPHEELPQLGKVAENVISESGADAHPDSPLPTEQPTTLRLDQKPPQRGNIEKQLTAQTHTGPVLAAEQATIEPLDQKQPSPPARFTDEHRPLENWVQVISVIVAILTFVAIAVQAWIYDQQRTIMSTQVNNTQKNIQITERAYIGVASLKVDLAHGEIVVMLENIGRKPAKAITVKADAYHISTIKLRKGAKKDFNAGDVRLFPGSFKMRVVVPMPECNPQEIKAIRENRQFLYVDGIIQYDDGFGFTDSTTFAFKYIPPPREGWEAVDTPVAHLEERLISEVFRLSLDDRITIDPPSFERSRKLSPPIYVPLPSGNTPSPSASTPSPGGTRSPSVSTPSPAGITPSPSTSATIMGAPALTRRRSVSSQCACSCRITCGNTCEYECSGCGMIEGVQAASVCCEKAQQSAGEMAPCPGQN